MHDSFGTDTKPFQVGRAAQNGLMAVLLAKSGFSDPLDGLEAERGWTHVVSTRENITAEFATLGETWETTKSTFKPFPCDRIIHAAIDGWIQLRAQALKQNLDITSITNVTARTHPRVLFLTDDPEPKTGLESKFSIYHAAALALLYGEATASQFLDDVAQNLTVSSCEAKSTSLVMTPSRSMRHLCLPLLQTVQLWTCISSTRLVATRTHLQPIN